MLPTIESTNLPGPLNNLEVILSVLVFLLWVGLIAAGVAISSGHYVDNLGAPTKHSVWVVLGSGLVVMTCHIVPNIALLSCLAAYLGVLASRTFPSPTRKPLSWEDHRATFTIAITRGFYVYLIILSGSVLFSSEGFGQWTSPKLPNADARDYETYTRLAGLASLFSFTAGYNPELFSALLARVSQFESKVQPPVRSAGGGEAGKLANPPNEQVDHDHQTQTGVRSKVPQENKPPH